MTPRQAARAAADGTVALGNRPADIQLTIPADSVAFYRFACARHSANAARHSARDVCRWNPGWTSGRNANVRPWTTGRRWATTRRAAFHGIVGVGAFAVSGLRWGQPGAVCRS